VGEKIFSPRASPVELVVLKVPRALPVGIYGFCFNAQQFDLAVEVASLDLKALCRFTDVPVVLLQSLGDVGLLKDGPCVL